MTVDVTVDRPFAQYGGVCRRSPFPLGSPFWESIAPVSPFLTDSADNEGAVASRAIAPRSSCFLYDVSTQQPVNPR
ncbi:hypothetical protein CKA32_004426 [Geitlerinema sp. FC II]|nr:hypothetical protein [Geitlerinema sp. CS-897]PPT11312.1 hypothetical protein CKA32_004426 [Geitlerinema sp. FC II]